MPLGAEAEAVRVAPERRKSEGRAAHGSRRQGLWWTSLPPSTSLDGCGEVTISRGQLSRTRSTSPTSAPPASKPRDGAVVN